MQFCGLDGFADDLGSCSLLVAVSSTLEPLARHTQNRFLVGQGAEPHCWEPPEGMRFFADPESVVLGLNEEAYVEVEVGRLAATGRNPVDVEVGDGVVERPHVESGLLARFPQGDRGDLRTMRQEGRPRRGRDRQRGGPGAGRADRPSSAPACASRPVEARPDHPHLVSPRQWTQECPGGLTGADWDSSDWGNYGLLETLYPEPMAMLMRGDSDAEAMRFWIGKPDWAGLLRALFITLRPEQDERPDDPEHVPWRLRWMKEKWGTLNIRTTRSTRYQRAAVGMVESMSGTTCRKCGALGEMRWARWVRPECDACCARAPDEDRAFAERWQRRR